MSTKLYLNNGVCWGSSYMIVECSRWRRSNILTDPSAPTDANISRPPPAIEKMVHVILDKFLWIHILTENKWSSVSKIFCLPLLNAMSYTSLSWAISCVLTCPVTMLTLPITCPVSSPHIVHVVSMLEVPFVNKNYTINFGFQAPIYKINAK